ncbi:hypothetical protein F4553_003064 [Allocatelliglobosispora scoriae]|uniref:Uncharacterized protein n=1 Tax=Allocatelliglobosispora scoriae TaxID=643052 RepID=A0A841BPS3_9ACTN|nr:hypothetical protein [Allocatelliglobosispora scoriae]MBB5869685.1 hypothetical protein [Allocatelliglobosispora scoriae]
MDYFVYAVALLLVVAVALFIKSVFFDKRPQKLGLAFAVLSVPLFMIYYADRWPWGNLPMRKLVSWLDNFEGADSSFKSDISPAFVIAVVLLIHLVVLQRVAAGRRLERLQDPIATFFASTFFASSAGGVLVSTFHWGWTGAVIVAVVYTLVYLGALALLAAIIEVLVELVKLAVVWLKRRAFAIATAITRGSSFVSSLSGRLGLTSLADKIRAEKDEQELTFTNESDMQDKELYAAFLRDRASQRRMAGRSEEEVAAELAELSAPEAEAPVVVKPPRQSRKKAAEPVAEQPVVEPVSTDA